jgi:hypothetical protein
MTQKAPKGYLLTGNTMYIEEPIQKLASPPSLETIFHTHGINTFLHVFIRL